MKVKYIFAIILENSVAKQERNNIICACRYSDKLNTLWLDWNCASRVQFMIWLV